MRVEVVRRLERQGVEIFLFDQLPTGSILAYTLGERGAWERHDVAPGAEMPVFLFLPQQAFEALMGAGVDFLPPSAATDAALKDAREVRDRLLGLVESAFPLNVIAPRDPQ